MSFSVCHQRRGRFMTQLSVLLPLRVLRMSNQRWCKVIVLVLSMFSQCAACLLIELCSETVDFHLYNNGTKLWPFNSLLLGQEVKAVRGDA